MAQIMSHVITVLSGRGRHAGLVPDRSKKPKTLILIFQPVMLYQFLV